LKGTTENTENTERIAAGDELGASVLSVFSVVQTLAKPRFFESFLGPGLRRDERDEVGEGARRVLTVARVISRG
jgi:hypothetical protein